MSQIADTQDEWTIHALNIHGVFFERRCATTIAETQGWKVLSTNYPVEYPPPNGPWRGKESSVDIWARRDGDPSAVVDALIECKKANPDFVNWVFFPRHDSPSPAPFRFTSATNTPNEAGTGTWASELAIQVGTTSMVLANDARKVRGDYVKQKGGNKTKTSNAAIQEAAYQIALANRAIIQEDFALLAKARQLPEHSTPPWLYKSYIPIIATTANLFRVDFSPSSTNLSTGEIEFIDATLAPVQSILYEYALPKHLQHSPQDPLTTLKGNNIDTFSRMHILVVQSDELSNLLLNLFASPT